MAANELLAHLQTHTCLPFPAGPVIPREHTGQHPDDEFGPKSASRALIAFKLIGLEHDFTRRAQRNPKSPLTHLMMDSKREWQTRHPTLIWDPVKATIEDELMSALVGLSETEQKPLPIEDFLGRYAEERSRGRVLQHDELPFGAPSYSCRCLGRYVSDAVDPEPNAYVTTVLAMPEGEWLLLSMFFLKQFHSHLAWVPTTQRHKAARPLYDWILQTLREFARRRRAVAWSETAAGLLIGLPQASPHFAHWSNPDSKLAKWPTGMSAPGCFRPEWLDERQRGLSEAKRLLAGHGELQALVEGADALAREVASRLTDPILVARSGLKATALGHLTNAYEKATRELRTAAAKAQSGEQPDAMTINAASIDQAYVRRRARLLSYVNWMTKRGLKFTKTAASQS